MFKLKLISITFLILIILYQQQTCNGFPVVGMINYVSAVIGLGQFIYNRFNRGFDESEILNQLNIQYENLNIYFEKIINSTNRAAFLTNFLEMKEDIAEHLMAINSAYIQSRRIMNDANNKTFYPPQTYREMSRNEPKLKEHFIDLHNIIFHNQWAPFKENDFDEQMQNYEDICAISTSHMHLLDQIFSNLKLATLNFLKTEMIYHDSLYIFKGENYMEGNKRNIDNARKNLIDYINKKYRNAIIRMKAAMARASNEVWSCDPLRKKEIVYVEVPVMSNGIIGGAGINDRNRIYVNNLPIVADKNNVVIGVKLEFKENLLYLNIKQGKLLPNGSTEIVGWKDNRHATEYRTEMNGERGMHGIDLTEVKLPDDHVIIGLQLKNGNDSRIHLSVRHTKIDFRKGIFIGSPLTTDALQGQHEFSVGGYNISTLANIYMNNINAQYDKYVEFDYTKNYTLSPAMRKVSKRFTIPYFDVQKIEPNIILSGIGLIHQGQKGFGGFISLKLYTFNFTSYIVNDMEIETYPKLFNTSITETGIWIHERRSC